MASRYGISLLGLAALGDNGVESSSNTLARGLEAGEQPKGWNAAMPPGKSPNWQNGNARVRDKLERN